METALVALLALACPIGMGLCMWMMARGMRSSNKHSPEESGQPTLAELRAERDRLSAEVDHAEREQAQASAEASNGATVQRA